MGYYTDYEIVIHPKMDNDTKAKFCEVFEAQTGFSYNSHIDDMKWYSSGEDMCEISKQFPEFLFSLYGNGEEKDDIWVYYCKNGKKQEVTATITFDPYDPEKMK